MVSVPGPGGTSPTEPALMRGLLEGVPDPAAVLDSELRYVAFNKAYAELVGTSWSAPARLGAPVDPALAGRASQDGLTVSGALARAVAGTSTSHVLGWMRALCHPLWGSGGQVCGVLHLLQDQRPSGREGGGTPSWLRLGAALQLAGAPADLVKPPRIRVFAWDAALGDLAWSGSLQDFAGLVSQLPGGPRGHAERMHPEDSRRLADRILAWQREGRTEASFDFRLVQQDGTERWMDAWARLVPAGGGTPARLVGINVDVTDLVRTERELRESRAAYERLFDVCQDGIVLMSLPRDGPPLVRSANVALGRLVGRTPAELEGMPFTSLAPAPERPVLGRQLADLASGGGLQHEFTLETGAGPVRVEATSRAFDEGGHTLVLSVVRDITPRALREQDLTTREQWFRTMAEALPSIVWSTNAEGDVRYYNASWFAYTGLSPAEGLGEGWTQVIHPEDRPRLLKAWRQAVALGERYEQEGRVRSRDGRYRWFLHRGYPVEVPGQERPRWLGTSTDIDLVKVSEVALRERERWLGSIVDTIPHMVWTADPHGSVEFQSRKLVQYTGGPPRRAPLAPWAFHPDDEARAAAAWRSMLDGGAETSGEYRLRRHDGTYRWFSVAAAPLKDAEGHVVRWMGTWTDIAPQKAALELLQEADRRKDEFLAVLSHELRNPLTPIRLGLGILERVPPGGPAWTRAFSILHRQSDQLSRLVDDLLDLTRMTRGRIRLQLRPLDLVALVAECAEDHRGMFERLGVGLDVVLPGEPCWVKADGIRLAQAVGNLLQNSAKFTPRGGSAQVTVRPRGAAVDVVVEDTGQGISRRMMPRLFEPFAQEEGGIARSKGGLGLGLALVKTLALMHGGSVSAASAGEGRGARFTVTLPTGPSPEPRAEGPQLPMPSAPRRVLVIEDNPDAAESLQALLELEGHAVTVATDGKTGVERALAIRPDVVLCDIGLPGMDGYAVARALAATPGLAGTRLYALTGYASSDDVRRAREAGFAALIPKPPTEAQLAEAVAGRA